MTHCGMSASYGYSCALENLLHLYNYAYFFLKLDVKPNPDLKPKYYTDEYRPIISVL